MELINRFQSEKKLPKDARNGPFTKGHRRVRRAQVMI